MWKSQLWCHRVYRKKQKERIEFFFSRKYLEILRDAILVNTYWEQTIVPSIHDSIYIQNISKYIFIQIHKYIYMYTYICPRYVYRRCGALRNSITHSIFWQPLCFPAPLLTPRRTFSLGLARSSFGFVKKFCGLTRFCLRHSATMYHATWPT